MFLNSKGEYIVFNSTKKNYFIYVDLAGQTNPNPNYKILHNVNKYVLYDSYVFEYVLDGKGYIEYDDKCVCVEKGDMYFLNKLRKHIYYSDPNNPYTKIFIVVNGIFVDKLVEAYSISESVIIQKIDIKDLILNIHNILQKEPVNYDEISIEILKIFQLIKNDVHSHSNKKLSVCELIKAYIDNNIFGKINLEFLSQQLNLSISYIERIFKESYGFSPIKYFIDKKIEYACAILVNTTDPISKVSEQLSFNDEKYFSKCFKKRTGITPLQYRKRNKIK